MAVPWASSSHAAPVPASGCAAGSRNGAGRTLGVAMTLSADWEESYRRATKAAHDSEPPEEKQTERFVTESPTEEIQHLCGLAFHGFPALLSELDSLRAQVAALTAEKAELSRQCKGGDENYGALSVQNAALLKHIATLATKNDALLDQLVVLNHEGDCASAYLLHLKTMSTWVCTCGAPASHHEARNTIVSLTKERDEARAENAARRTQRDTFVTALDDARATIAARDEEIAGLKAALSAAETCTRCGVFKTCVDDAHKHAALCGGEFKLGGG